MSFARRSFDPIAEAERQISDFYVESAAVVELEDGCPGCGATGSDLQPRFGSSERFFCFRCGAMWEHAARAAFIRNPIVLNMVARRDDLTPGSLLEALIRREPKAVEINEPLIDRLRKRLGERTEGGCLGEGGDNSAGGTCDRGAEDHPVRSASK